MRAAVGEPLPSGYALNADSNCRKQGDGPVWFAHHAHLDTIGWTSGWLRFTMRRTRAAIESEMTRGGPVAGEERLMPDIKMFISCHKDDVHIPHGNGLLYPVQVGAALAGSYFPTMLHDDDGDSISSKNPSYCELTGQYWVWKNVRADYYGFLHYRRYLNFSGTELPIVHEPFVFGEVVQPANRGACLREIGFNEKTMRQVIGRYDFIAPVPVTSPENETVYEQYVGSVGHHKEDIDAVRDIVADGFPEFTQAFDRYMGSRKIVCCNMFVANHAIFQEYCAWLFSILGEFERTRDTSGYDEVERRVVGYLAERLCGVYVTYLKEQGARVGELQRVYFRSVSKRATRPRLIAR